MLDFTNRSFAEFVRVSTGRDIYDSRYDYQSGSKANQLRAFWQKEENAVVGKLMGDILDYCDETETRKGICRLIITRLLHDSPASRVDIRSEHKEQQDQQQQRRLILAQLKEGFPALLWRATEARPG